MFEGYVSISFELLPFIPTSTLIAVVILLVTGAVPCQLPDQPFHKFRAS